MKCSFAGFYSSHCRLNFTKVETRQKRKRERERRGCVARSGAFSPRRRTKSAPTSGHTGKRGREEKQLSVGEERKREKEIIGWSSNSKSCWYDWREGRKVANGRREAAAADREHLLTHYTTWLGKRKKERKRDLAGTSIQASFSSSSFFF